MMREARSIPKSKMPLATLAGQPLLIHSSPQVMLLAIDLNEDLIEAEGIADASVLSRQSTSV